MFLRIQCEERISVEQLSDVGYWFDRRMCERAVVASRGRRFVSNKEKINRLISLSLSFFPPSLPLSSPPFPRLSSTISARCPKATDGSGYVRHVNFRFLSLFLLARDDAARAALYRAARFSTFRVLSSPLPLVCKTWNSTATTARQGLKTGTWAAFKLEILCILYNAILLC